MGIKKSTDRIISHRFFFITVLVVLSFHFLAFGLLLEQQRLSFLLSFYDYYAPISIFLFVGVFISLRSGLLFAFISAFFVFTLFSLSSLKAQLNGIPIAWSDLKIASNNPGWVLDALGINRFLGFGLLALVTGIALLSTYLVWRYDCLRINKVRVRSVKRSVLVCLAILIFHSLFLLKLGRTAANRITKVFPDLKEIRWQSDFERSLLDKVGGVVYLAYSREAERRAEGAFFNQHFDKPLKVSETLSAASRYILFKQGGAQLLPNIVFVLLESTFNPNWEFKLDEHKHNALWSPRTDTKLLQALQTSVIGGGTWVSEFQTLTGLDNRIFGYLGYYTHYSAAPHIQWSFPIYLSDKGYNISAFSPNEGEFFQTQSGFRYYGIDHYTDAEALKFSEDWSKIDDLKLMRRVLSHKLFSPDHPSFIHISTLYNHGPHTCKHLYNTKPLMARFEGVEDFSINCHIGEYIRRANNTGEAIEELISALQDEQLASGRPYVVVTYGDHQPYSFTSGQYSISGGTDIELGFTDFTPYRTNQNLYRTVGHIYSSVNNVTFKKFNTEIPLYLLPTLASAFVTTNYQDLFMPENLYAYEVCGASVSRTCDAYRSIVSSWRSANIKR